MSESSTGPALISANKLDQHYLTHLLRDTSFPNVPTMLRSTRTPSARVRAVVTPPEAMAPPFSCAPRPRSETATTCRLPVMAEIANTEKTQKLKEGATC